MKILAVYGSNYGQAKAVLERVTATLEGRGHAVTTFKGDAVPTDVAVADFDAVLVAGSVRIGKYQPYILDFVKRNIEALRSRPTAFISVSGTRPESLPEWREESAEQIRKFLEQAGWEPTRTGMFAGKLQYRSYDPITRWMMRGISKKRNDPVDTSRDYEYTDWDAVDRFAGELADGLGNGEAAG
jgi:menaquinone-dependent protoporphyrinogen oxidase